MTRHPIQPLEDDGKGVIRFKANAIVRYLLDHGGIDLNKLALLDFSREDREQFAQLIGYSHSGACDLGYMTDETLSAARQMYDAGKSELQARLEDAEAQLADLRKALREPMAELFHVHPDDLGAKE